MARHPDHAERASVLNRAFEGRRRRRRSRNGLANESEKRTERKRVRDVSGAEEERVGDTERGKVEVSNSLIGNYFL